MRFLFTASKNFNSNILVQTKKKSLNRELVQNEKRF